jgi:hypothetical protein
VLHRVPTCVAPRARGCTACPRVLHRVPACVAPRARVCCTACPRVLHRVPTCCTACQRVLHRVPAVAPRARGQPVLQRGWARHWRRSREAHQRREHVAALVRHRYERGNRLVPARCRNAVSNGRRYPRVIVSGYRRHGSLPPHAGAPFVEAHVAGLDGRILSEMARRGSAGGRERMFTCMLALFALVVSIDADWWHAHAHTSAYTRDSHPFLYARNASSRKPSATWKQATARKCQRNGACTVNGRVQRCWPLTLAENKTSSLGAALSRGIGTAGLPVRSSSALTTVFRVGLRKQG